jgi:dipeptidyl aminopeptidase/acylaminoacyl peptidase
MRLLHVAMSGVFIGFSTAAATAAPGVSGPHDRQITDPTSVVSVASSNARPVAVEDLYVTRLIDGAALSPNGADVAVITNMTGRPNLWTVPTAGSWPVQLVNSDERQAEPRWSPDSRWIAYSQDKGGNELWDIYIVSRQGGSPVNLTSTPDIREQHPVWSHDARNIACTYKPKQASSYDLAIVYVATRKLRKLTDERDPQQNWDVIGFSPDDKVLYANRTSAGFDDGDVYAVDVASGRRTNLTAHQGKQLNIGTDVSPDGSAILLTSNRKDGYQNAALLDLVTGKLAWATDTQWEITSGGFSPDGKQFTYAINADGRTTLHRADRRTLRSTTLKLPPGVNTLVSPQHFSPDGRTILLQHEALNTPNDLWVFDTGSERARQLTHMSVAGLTPQTLPPSQIVHYRSFDGKIISAILQMPFNLKRDASNPAIIFPHGGPTWQMPDYWNRWSNALATRGYIVLMPNPRGSTGYGMEFQRANYQDLGGGDLKDEIYGLEWLLGSGYVDPNKVGVFGGSYGGFMTLMLAAKEPARFAAAVDLFGPLDFFSMLQHADPTLAAYVRSLLGDPEKDRKVYEDNSPIKYVEAIRAPLLVLQGDNDPRIPKEESERLVEILKKRGNVVEVVYYPDEGHGFDKVEHQIDAARRIVGWFDRYLKKTPMAPAVGK